MLKTTVHTDSVPSDSVRLHDSLSVHLSQLVNDTFLLPDSHPVNDSFVAQQTIPLYDSAIVTKIIPLQSQSVPQDTVPHQADTLEVAPSDTYGYWESLARGLQASEYHLLWKTDSLKQSSVSVARFPGYEGTKISEKPKEMDAVFLIFFGCFMLAMSAFSNGKQLLTSLVNTIFRVKNRSSIFYETTGKDFRNKMFLVLQSVFVFSIFSYVVLSHCFSIVSFSVRQGLTCIGSFSVLFLVFLLYKWVMYRIVCDVFFDKARYDRWIENWNSLIIFSGIVTFIPVLLLYYVHFLFYFNFYLVFLYIFAVFVIIVYKSYALFFNGIRDLHYLILYLCVQEIIPLFLLCGGLIYVFKLVEAGTLWI